MPRALANPLAGNPLRTRADVQRALRDLFEPLVPHFSEGAARVKLGSSGVWFSEGAEELEGFARPLWGIVPLVLGGGDFAHWELYRRGLANGSDPDHPEFWGWAERDQRMVEMAAIGFALAFLPEQVWEPLEDRARDNLVRWLDRINHHLPFENNWQFFRVLVNLGLARVGRFDADAAQRESLDLLESWYLGDGWYVDGRHRGRGDHVDYYIPWAFHAYGLVYAASDDADPDFAKRYRERARLFAHDFLHWFDPQGAAVPFGRSLTYRFAQGAFWGALALADEEALPWGVVKGLWLRHLRWWSGQPIADRDGVLSIGYGYSNLFTSEPYNSSGSPYWAMKFFLGLAARDDHPFWQAEEEPLPALGASSPQRHTGMVFTRDATQAIALSGGQAETLWPNGAAKYAKFAYSSVFGFSVAANELSPVQGCHDSMLALREETGPWRVRIDYEERRLEGNLVYSRWRPWPDVVIETVLAGRAPWHVRLHRIRTEREIWSREAGFALPWDGHEPGGTAFEDRGGEGAPLASSPYGVSGIRALDSRPSPESPNSRPSPESRAGRVQPALPNTNLIAPRTVVPILEGHHGPGEYLLACAVAASDRAEAIDWENPPEIPSQAWKLLDGVDS